MMRDNRGFTFIELLVVVSIIGIIAAAAVPQILDAICDSRVAAAKTDIATIHKSMVQCQRIDNCDHQDTTSLSNHDLVPDRIPSEYTINANGSNIIGIRTANVGCIWNGSNSGLRLDLNGGEYQSL